MGDICQINGGEIEPVDIVTFGAPCQDVSIAGGRAGVKHNALGDAETTRSGLVLEALRIIKEMRESDRKRGYADQSIRCRYAIYENVPGALSSNKGKDWQTIITETVRIVAEKAPDYPMPENGKWPKASWLFGVGDDGQPFSLAWRIHDAQYWGVPQRRKRICLLADFSGLTAPWILFDPEFERTTESGEPIEALRDIGAEPRPEVQSERESLPGNTEPIGAEREETPGAVRGGTEGASERVYGIDHVMLSGGTTYQGRGYYADVSGCLKTQPHGVCRIGCEIEKAPTLSATASGLEPTVLTATAYSFDSLASNSMKSANPNSGCREVDVAKTLDCFDPNPSKNQGGIAILTIYQGAGKSSVSLSENVSPTLATTHDGAPAVYDARGNGDGKTVCTITGDHQNRVTDYTAIVSTYSSEAYDKWKQNEVGSSLRASGGMYQGGSESLVCTAVDCRNGTENENINGTLQAKEQCFSYNCQNVCRCGSVVRRLTPLECERLQGFPDIWSRYGINEKGEEYELSDTARYKLQGNSIARPFWTWLLKRISAQYEQTPAVGGLFEGQGGFTLCALEAGIKPKWSSEVEKNAVSVLRKHFGDMEMDIEGDLFRWVKI